MPQSSNESPPLGAWPGGLLIALLIGLGAIGWVQTPFKPERPSESKEGLRTVGVQDVDARLWQDPFAAVAEARKAHKAARSESECRMVEIGADGRSLLIRGACPEVGRGQGAGITDGSSHGIGRLQGQILARAEALDKAWAADPQARPLTVLGVMVSAGPASGAAEARRRYRYAVLSALMLEGFLPDDPEHIGYTQLSKGERPELMPYEWFTRTTDALHQGLLLLWLDDDSLSAPDQPTGARGAPVTPGAARPLARLSHLLSGLAETGAALTRVGFQLIGPAGSGTLKAMADEQRDYVAAMSSAPPGAPAATRVARLWSPFATVPDKYLGFGSTLRSVCPCGQAGPACVAVLPPATVDRTIVTDDILADLLVAELDRRGVSGTSGIALVGQWDTAYSRTLAELVEQAWLDRQPPDGPNRVKRFSYMRGVDGRIPGAKDSGEAEARAVERPGGDAQIDYLRRMRDALLAEDRRQRHLCGLSDRLGQRCGIRAIGVLGNDYYDKLLVLQALRPVFPEAVFFTTDLYAEMLHPGDNPFTRNLVVASGYGLTLDEDWQRDVPPLRDGYQTALLLTVRLAVRETLGYPGTGETPPPPRLFEVGRTRAVELVTLPDVDAQGRFRRDGRPEWLDPHPEAELSAYYRLGPPPAPGVVDPGIQGKVLPLGLAMALVLVLASIGLERTRATLHRWWLGLRRGWLPSAIAAFSIAATVSVLVLMGRDLAQGGEPFSIWEGVSVWPSELLRLVAGLVAVGFFLHGHRRQREARDRIEQELPGIAGPSAEMDAASGQVGPAPPRCGDPERAGPSACVTEVWARYRARCGLPQTLRRTWPEILAFLILACCLMVTLGLPNRPTRSDLSWGLDLAIVTMFLVPFLALLFFMVDATRQTLALARDLRGEVRWSRETLTALGLGDWASDRHRQAQGADMVWLDVRLIAAATRPVGNLVWYPVLVLILIALARHPLFDAWSLPPSLVLVMGIALVYAIGCAWILRRAAEGVRADAIAQLSAAILRAQGCPEAKESLEPLKTMRAEVIATREGAFRPFTQQPVVQALLTLVSSVSGLALLEYSSMANL